MAKVIKYSRDEILSIGANIKAILSEEIIKSLMEIKINNKFIRRNSPIKLKYTMNKTTTDTWRKEKSGESQKSDGEKFVEKLNSEFNKISESNYNKIKDGLLEYLVDKNNEEYMSITLDTIFNKSVNESTFSHLYARLVKPLITIFGEKFKTDLINRVNKFYDTNIKKKFSLDIENISYDELCKINKEKQKLLGAFTFMGGLYINNYVENDVILKYFDTLIECTLSDNIDNVEKYVECVCTLIGTIGEKLEKSMGSDFENLIIEKLKLISSNRKKFKPRIRFLVLDIIELKTNSWKK